ncbi:hypothetical protein RHS01_06495 [Rhizoctonia solani]|uniref:Uncharacterized protein n=1 Tax=Rhizoctonia solani TaxID=456999 RepID=A0A8H7M658_9AGAM|nr:hypothetical protein RHS01_06495 [Rhizoctonia solani]
MSFAQSFYCFPIFTTYRNDVPLSPETGIIEANHVRDLYYIYANRHNDHPSPYSENPDPLERRIHAMPDVEVFLMADDHPPQWFLGVDLAHALHGAYYHALQVFGDAVQPTGWNRHDPWGNYDYASKLEEINFPYIPRPICFTRDLYHFPLTPSMNYSAKSTTTISMSSVSTRFPSLLMLPSRTITATWLMLGTFVVPLLAYQHTASGVVYTGTLSLIALKTIYQTRVSRISIELIMCTKYPRICVTGFPINGYDADDESLGLLTPPTEVSPPPALEEFAEQIFDYAAWGLEPPVIPSPTESTGWDSNTAIHSLRRSLSPCTPQAMQASTLPPQQQQYELDVNALTEQLAQVAVVQDADPAPPSFSADFVKSVWEWPGEPQPVAIWDLLSGPPYRSSTRLRFHGKTIGTRFAPAT